MRHPATSWPLLLTMAVVLAAAGGALAAGGEEFRVKREAVFEFARRPTVQRQGDRVVVSFASKGYCDATVAVEDADGRIVRHLASGVLGQNAPPPFQKNSREQAVVWDGKDDRGEYVDDKDALTVRVSLGLAPRFERTLDWSPHKRISTIAPLMADAPEGVYEFEGQGVDHLRLFDHEGNYLRTVYPFPAGQVDKVVGLQSHTYPQDGATLPLKMGYEQATLLTSGSSAWGGGGHPGGWGATAMAVHGRHIALAFHKLNRLATDGSSGGLPIQGPSLSYTVRMRDRAGERRDRVIGPTSIAFSPDGNTLYLTGYVWKDGERVGNANCYHVVKRMQFAGDDPPTVFAGVDRTDDGWGTGDDRLCVPTSVACDAAGRVYVADYVNQRIQVFSPEGKLLRSIPAPYPATIRLDPKTGEIWSFSWTMIGPSSQVMRERDFNPEHVSPTVSRLGTFDAPAAKPQCLPLPEIAASTAGGREVTAGQVHSATVDFDGPEPTIWLAGRRAAVTVAEANWMGGGGIWSFLGRWDRQGVRLLRLRDGQWREVLDFARVAREKVLRLDPPQFARSRLVVNPATGMLYICEEQTGPGKSFYSVLQLDPATGGMQEVRLPFDAEDIAFDIQGRIYMCTDREIMRFDPKSWREVPWDYGEDRNVVRFASSGSIPSTPAVSALPIPGRRPVWWHSSGMWVSPRGHLGVVVNIPDGKEEPNAKDKYYAAGVSKPYKPTVYPGRTGNRVVLVFDPYGKLLYDDAVPGLTNCDGLGIDRDDNLYAMVAAPRVLDGEPYFNEKSETLMKFRPGAAKFYSSDRAAVAMAEDQTPNRPADVTKYGMGRTWVEGAEWMYGGVGYGGQGGSCVCFHSRFQLDYFGRSFAPEVRRFCIAVLDSGGNLILRIGRYGNVDDGEPLIPDGGPPHPRSIGGDEVALAHAAYVGVHTDRRLFIHDAGNGRILAVKLGYHTTEKIALRDVPDRRGEGGESAGE